VSGPFIFGRFIRRRGKADAGLLFGVGLAVLIATMVIGGSPAYLRSLDRVGVEGVLDDLPPIGKNIVVTNDAVPSRLSAVDAVTGSIDETIAATLGDVASPPRRTLRSPLQRNRDLTSAHNWSLARLVLVDGFIDNVEFVDGGPPGVIGGSGDAIVEAVILAELADQIDISTGDTLTLQNAFGGGSTYEVQISGTFELKDPKSEFWMGLSDSLVRPQSIPGFIKFAAGLVVTEEGFGALTLKSAASPLDATWIVDLDQERLAELDDDEIVDMVVNFKSRLEQAVPGSRVLTRLEKAFRALERRAVFSRIPIFLLATIVITIVAYYLLMAANVLSDRRKDEIGVLRSRGVSLLQMTRLYGLEAAMLVAIPVVIGPIISVIVIAQSGRFPPFDGVTGGQTLPVTLEWDQFLLSFLTGLVALTLLVSPTVLSGVGNVVVQLRSEGRSGQAPFFQRYFLDVAVLVLAGFLIWELSASGSEVIRVDQDGGLNVDPTLFLAPALALLGGSMIFLRVFPVIVKALAIFMGRFGPAWAALAVWRLARAPYFYAPVVLLLMLASGLAVVAATLTSTLQDIAQERVLYETGSDIHIEAIRDAVEVGQTISEFSSVTGTSAAMRVAGEIGTGRGGSEFELLGVQSERFADLAWFRPDFSDKNPQQLMRDISPGSKLKSLYLPDSATDLGVWTQMDDDIQNLFLWATVRGGTGIVETVTLGPLRKGEWRLQTASLKGIVAPIELLSIKLFEPSGEDRSTAGMVKLDDFVAINSSNGDRTVLIDFDQLDQWTPFPTSEGLDTVLTLGQEAGGTGEQPGSGVGRLEFGRGSDGGVRGIYRSTSGGPLPVIVSSTLARNAGITLSNPFIARLPGGLTPLVAVDVVDYFPTLNPDNDDGFMVVDLDSMSNFLDLKGALTTGLIDELFVGVLPESHDQALEDINSALSNAPRVGVRRDLQDESLVDPLSVAGWRGAGIFAGVTTLVVVLLSYLTYLRAYAGKMNTEEAFVRSMGFSRLNYMATAAIEHLSLGLVGIALGLASGLAVAGLAVGISTRTSTGDEPLPPFILETRWEPVLLGYALLGLVAIAAIALLTVRYGRRALHEATRMQE